MKIEVEEKFKHIAQTLKEKGYAKRAIPSPRQIKAFLKKEKKINATELTTINEGNLLYEWAEFI